MGLLSMLGLGAPTATSVENGAVGVIEAIGDAGDKLFTSDEEKAQWSVLMEKAKQSPAMIQAVITANEEKNSSKYIAAARATLIYALVASLTYNLLIRDFVIMAFHVLPADVPASPLSVSMILNVLGQLMGVSVGG